MIQEKSFHLVSLGCAKNSVDSESMAQVLGREGYQSLEAPDRAEFLIVNTCGFIGPAKDESYQVLQELAEDKESGQWLIAAGCLSQRYGSEVIERVPGIDGILGTRRWMDVMTLVSKIRENKSPEPIYHIPENALTVGQDEGDILRISHQGPSAYIKIADGCRRPCAFCAIPLIKGTLVRRPMEAILAEAEILQEAILVAEELLDVLTAEQAKYENTDETGNTVEDLAKDLIAELESRKDSLVRQATSQ